MTDGPRQRRKGGSGSGESGGDAGVAPTQHRMDASGKRVGKKLTKAKKDYCKDLLPEQLLDQLVYDNNDLNRTASLYSRVDM